MFRYLYILNIMGHIFHFIRICNNQNPLEFIIIYTRMKNYRLKVNALLTNNKLNPKDEYRIFSKDFSSYRCYHGYFDDIQDVIYKAQELYMWYYNKKIDALCQ